MQEIIDYYGMTPEFPKNHLYYSISMKYNKIMLVTDKLK